MSNEAPNESEYARTARKLAEAHRAADPETSLILLDRDPGEQEIRLLEVSKPLRRRPANFIHLPLQSAVT